MQQRILNAEESYKCSACFGQVLSDHGAQMGVRDLRGYSPAHLAISHGHSITLRALVSAGAVFLASWHCLWQLRNVRRISVRGSVPPCCLRRRTF